MSAKSFDDLETDRVNRVQSGHRLLENVGNFLTAEFAQCGDVGAQHLDALHLYATGDLGVRREETHEAHRRRRLARARFTNDGENLAGLDVVVHVYSGWIPLAIYPEVNVVVRYFKNHWITHYLSSHLWWDSFCSLG